MTQGSQRADYRVEVPGEFIREIALWVCQPADYVRLEPAALGRPHLRYTRLGPEHMVITDLSIRGMGLALTLPGRVQERLKSVQAVFVYLQLWDPTADDPHGLLTVFMYCQVKRVADRGAGIFMGLTFTRFAVGSKYAKHLEFLSAERVGVTELARWCDNLSRGVAYKGDPDNPGLNLENLLVEVEEALSPTASHTQERS